MKQKNIAIMIFIIGLISIVIYLLGGFESQAVALNIDYYSQSDCNEAMQIAYGDNCDSCMIRCSDTNYEMAQAGQTHAIMSDGSLLDISMCEMGGGLGNLIQWYGDASFCTTSLTPDGSCSPSVIVSENCQSATGHIDSRCSSGVRCGSGTCYSTVYASNCHYVGDDYVCENDCGESQVVSTGCSLGGEWLSMNVPDTIKQLEDYHVTGSFRASCAGTYYLEAYQHLGSYQPFSVVVTSDVGQCDDNPGTAGDYVYLDTDEVADVDFTLKDYGQLGTYEVVLGAYPGCGASAYDSGSEIISVTSTGTGGVGSGFDWLTVGIFGGLTIFGIMILGTVVLFLVRKKK